MSRPTKLFYGLKRGKKGPKMVLKSTKKVNWKSHGPTKGGGGPSIKENGWLLQSYSFPEKIIRVNVTRIKELSVLFYFVLARQTMVTSLMALVRTLCVNQRPRWNWLSFKFVDNTYCIQLDSPISHFRHKSTYWASILVNGTLKPPFPDVAWSHIWQTRWTNFLNENKSD